MRERLRTLPNMKEIGYYFFTEPYEYDAKGVKKNFKPPAAQRLLEIANRFGRIDNWKRESLEKTVRDYCSELGIGAGKIIHPIRLAVSGLTGGPSLFEMLEILGRDTVIRRIKRAVDWIEKNVANSSRTE